jgi:hypothetical protein
VGWLDAFLQLPSGCPLSTEEKEQQFIEILGRINELAADAGDAFYDITGEDLQKWDEITASIFSIKETLYIIIESHQEEKRYR